MSAYDDYLDTVRQLGKAITDADHAAAQAQRATSAAVEKFDADLAASVKGYQGAAVSRATEYASAARLLLGRNAEGIGLQLPEKVRPVTTTASVEQAADRQRRAASGLQAALGEYEAAVAREAGAASAAAAALAARRAALAKPKPETVAEPMTPSAPEPVVEPKEPRIGPLGGLPLMWVICAVPLAGLGAVLSNPLLGVLAGAVMAFALAFWLVGMRRVSLGSVHAAAKAQKSDPGKRRASGSALERATEKGTISGYEPEALKAVDIPEHPLMHGKPGVGLSDSGFDQGAVRAGQTGEVNFAKALAKAGLIQRFATFWSIHMLSQDTYGKEQSDVDCAIVTGHTIYLVDLKYYPGGNVEYRLADGQQLVCYDVPTGQPIGQPKKMSKNMQIAVERFRSRYKNYGSFGLQARVVLVPTNSGVGRIEGVKWPGDIPAMMLPDFLAELQSQPSFIESLDSDLVRRTFQGLLKS